jgi:hypothetical protein
MSCKTKESGSIPAKVKGFFSSPQHQHQLWSPSSFPLIGSTSFLPREKQLGSKAVTHLLLVATSMDFVKTFI